MDRAEQVAQLIEPSLAAMGYRLVQVRLMGGQHRPTLQVMAERAADGSMGVQDCADVSRAVSAILDVEDPLPSAYVLEVSSPGIDRPLLRLEDFARFAGHEARIETRQPIEGRKRFRGQILGVDEGAVRLRLAAGEKTPDGAGDCAIPFAAVEKAKLVLTDALIAASLKRKG
ncbi:MAG: ribosome maturation factor RimP [Alphaproteobacteria bacterium]|nr:ribosome maturation factor RimP [Alphaproteobacteria bacterium]